MQQLFDECVAEERWVLISPLAPQVCEERLRAKLRTWAIGVPRITYWKAPLIGKVDGQAFRAQRGVKGNGFVAHGRLEPTPAGTRVTVDVTRTYETWGLVALVAAIILVLLVIGIVNL